MAQIREIRGPDLSVSLKDGTTLSGPAVIRIGDVAQDKNLSGTTNMVRLSEVAGVNLVASRANKGWRYSGRLSVSSVYKRGNAQKDDVDIDGSLELRSSDTVYNKDGFLFAKNNVNSYRAEKNDDGTYTVRFNCEGEANNIDTKTGNDTGSWNAILRAYRPSKLVQSGKWEPFRTVNNN